MKLQKLFTIASLFVLAAILALLPVASPVVAAGYAPGAAPASGTIPYSGRLSNDAGQPVADGAYAFRFALYDAVQDGNLLWSETQSGVTVKGGLFTAQLGNIAALPEAARARSVWLAVSVRGPDETAFTAMSPRQSLNTAVASAPSSPAASAACAHDHFGESWIGSTTHEENAGLFIENDSAEDSPVFWGYNSGSGTGVYGSTDNGTGVNGSAANGIGVRAFSANGAAIQIEGSIHVNGADIDSDTPVFIHKVVTGAGGNICSIQNYTTVIDNPIINSKPGAILIVTPNFGPNNTGVAPAVGIPAVYYDATNQCGKGAGKWVIYNLNAVALTNNSMYNVMAVLP